MLKRTPLAHTFTVLCVAGCLAVATTSGAQWAKTKRPSRGWITDMVVSGDDLYVCTRKGGIFRTSDDGQTWEKISKGLPRKADFQSLAVVDDRLLAGTVEQGVFASDDRGETWKVVGTGMPPGSSVWQMRAKDPYLYAVAGNRAARIFRSVDRGASWTEVSSGLPKTSAVCLVVSGANLFVGTSDGGVVRSTDDGDNWTPVNDGPLPTDLGIFRLESVGSDVFAGTYWGGRVLKSSDNGESWKPVCDGLPGFAVFSLSDLEVSGTSLFLAGCHGVFVLAQDSDVWTRAGTGLPEGASVYALSANDTYLFAGTEDGDVLRLPLSSVTPPSTRLAPDGYDQSSSKTATQDHGPSEGPLPSTDGSDAAEFRENLLSAEQGDAIAQFKVGYAYHYGIGVTPDQTESFRWMKLAAEQEVIEAQLNLGQYYEHGAGVDQDLEAARHWYHEAAEAGLPEAQFLLAKIYSAGLGVDSDFEEAARWMKGAAEQGLAVAQFAFALSCFHGYGVPLDLDAALAWMKRAANQNFAEAQFALGIWYEEGEGVEPDAATAWMWYALAASNDNQQAQEHLERLESSLTKKELKRAQHLARSWVEENL